MSNFTVSSKLSVKSFPYHEATLDHNSHLTRARLLAGRTGIENGKARREWLRIRSTDTTVRKFLSIEAPHVSPTHHRLLALFGKVIVGYETFSSRQYRLVARPLPTGEALIPFKK